MSLTQFQSSGNIHADRRYQYAQDLAQEGDLAAAADLYAQTLELAPDWAACWFAYGEILERLDRRDAAIAAFGKTMSLMPEDSLGAGLHLHRLGAAGNFDNRAYVAGLFDQYASRFETHLVEALNYRGPQIICDLLTQHAQKHRPFRHLIDLGCGTGLMARALRGQYIMASGVDLSANMIRAAEKTGLYQHLAVAELLDFLEAQPSASADLILAADVFVYCGALDDIFAQARRVLEPGGFFGFSTQKQDADGFSLGADYRFAHSQSYLAGLAADNDFVQRALLEQSARQDRGTDVPGFVVLLQRAG